MISTQIQTDLEQLLRPRGIVLENVLLRKIELPPRVTGAINEKLAAEQDSERMKFVLLKEKQEAERKQIEAEGIQKFQAIVAQGISDKLLEWKGIEATERLATSQNAKVVVIGSGKNGLPVIMNLDK
jgi:regulator of protease activity HflC (stomatin/prohibitin superfamily)